MDFFEAQDRARRSTRRLVVLYALAVLSIVAGVTLLVSFALQMSGSDETGPNLPALFSTALATLVLIGGATLYKTAALAAGGGRVASAMGGTLVTPDQADLLKQRLRNVVEEMAIASGIPAPEIYVLEAEPGINAFAAGHSPNDAAIAVTRGALEALNRDELQGVIAHEFSHVLNGDMRLNLRLMGVLFGIMVLSVVGRMILRGGYHSGRLGGRGQRRLPAVIVIGGGLAVLGAVGVFFARLIKAAVSRSREQLADASAVQFTRQTRGLANALKKIGGYDAGSAIRRVDPEEVSHMLFAPGLPRIASLFATHPPLIDRIRALDPSFRQDDYPAPPRRERYAAEQQQAAVTDGLPPDDSPATPVDIAGLVASVGRPTPRQVEYARRLRHGIPPTLYEAAHSHRESVFLVFALALDHRGKNRSAQLTRLRARLGNETAARIEDYDRDLRALGSAFYLPLLDIAMPVLKLRPAPAIDFLLTTVRDLVETDGEVNLREYAFLRVLEAGLSAERQDAGAGSRLSPQRFAEAAGVLLAIVATQGHEEADARRAAYGAGRSSLDASVVPHALPTAVPTTAAELDRQLQYLRRAGSENRRAIVTAVATVVAWDGSITVPEAELLRAICAALDCPMPPLAAS